MQKTPRNGPSARSIRYVLALYGSEGRCHHAFLVAAPGSSAVFRPVGVCWRYQLRWSEIGEGWWRRCPKTAWIQVHDEASFYLPPFPVCDFGRFVGVLLHHKPETTGSAENGRTARKRTVSPPKSERVVSAGIHRAQLRWGGCCNPAPPLFPKWLPRFARDPAAHRGRPPKNAPEACPRKTHRRAFTERAPWEGGCGDLRKSKKVEAANAGGHHRQPFGQLSQLPAVTTSRMLVASKIQAKAKFTRPATPCADASHLIAQAKTSLHPRK